MASNPMEFFDAIAMAGMRPDKRTPEGIECGVMKTMADRRDVTGHQDADQAFMKLILLREKDSEFQSALATVAKKVLEAFPIKDIKNLKPEGAA